MDEHILWDDFLNRLDTQNLPASPVFPSDTNMPCVNPVGEESADLRMWSSGGPSSSRHPVNPSTHEETKMELGWPSSLTIRGGQGSGTEERRLEATNMFLGLRTEDCGLDVNKMFSMEDVNLNLNSNQADSNQPFSENLSVGDSINSDQNAGRDGTSNGAPESTELLHPNSSRSLGSLQVSSSGGSLNLRGSSSSGIGFLTENFEGRSGSSLDDQRMSRKRKNIEGVPAQSSACGLGASDFLYQSENLVHPVYTHHSSNTSLNIPSSSNYPSGINPSVEQLNPRISTNVRLGASDFLPFNITANADSSQRNCRSRISSSQDGAAPPSIWLPGNSLLPSGPWPTHQPSLLIPFTQALDSRVVAAGTSETQPLVLPTSSLVPNTQPLSLTGASSSRTGSSRSTAIARQRTGSSTRSSAVAVQRTGSSTTAPAVAVQRTGSSRRAPAVIAQRSVGLREESSSRNNVSENVVFVPATDVRNLVQDPSSWGLANGNIGIGHAAPASQSVTPTQVQQLAGETWIHHQNAASHYQRVAEVVRRSSFSPVSSGAGQGVNLSQRSANSNTSQEITQQSAGAVRGHLRPYARSALSVDRHGDGLVGIPLRSLAAAREGRNRASSEGRNRVLSEQIRNAMQNVRRGENLHLQDILFFDHSVFYGGAADLHDRHRDLRLDVDNMSYEELLALEERIGNVNTGLTEETVMKYLKQRKYISLSEETPAEVEPCCVCQEEYVEGEDVGRLNCGHDFHTACIKQWLLMKNLCPICKTTGLNTEKHKEAHRIA